MKTEYNLALTVLFAFALSGGAAQRHAPQSLDPATIVQAISPVAITETSSECGGGGTTRQYASKTYTVPTCLGSEYRINYTLGGTFELKRSFTDHIGLSVSGNWTSGANDCYQKFDHPTDTCETASDSLTFTDNAIDPNARSFPMHGQDVLTLYYDTIDGSYNIAGNGGYFDLTILSVVDVHGQIILSSDKLLADGKTIIKAVASNPQVYPDQKCVWSITGETLGCTIVPGTETANICQLKAGKVGGPVTLRVANADNPSCFIETDITVCGAGCAICAQTGSNGLGGGSPANQSVALTIDLGKTSFGESAGSLQLDQKTPTVDLGDAKLLVCYPGKGGVEVLDPNVDGRIDQVKSSAGLLNVVQGAGQYTVEVYLPGNYGTTKDGTGKYPITGSTVRTWTVQRMDSGGTSVRITEAITAGSSYVTDFNWDSTVSGWEMVQDSGNRREKRYTTINGSGETVETYLVRDAQLNVKYQEINTYHNYAWNTPGDKGEMIRQEIGNDAGIGQPPASSANLVTTWEFYTDPNDVNDYSHVYRIVRPGGTWTRYESYDGGGRVLWQTQQYRNYAPNTIAFNNRVIVFHYPAWASSTYDYGVLRTELLWDDTTDSSTGFPHQQVVSQGCTMYKGNRVETKRFVNSQWQWPLPSNPSAFLAQFNFSPAGALVETTYLDTDGQKQRVIHEDGTYTTYSYSVSAGQKTTTVDTGHWNGGLVDDGSRVATVVNDSGAIVSETNYRIVPGGTPTYVQTSSMVESNFDSQGRAQRVDYNGGTEWEQFQYGCCNLDSYTDREGITASYTYDGMKRKQTETRAGITLTHYYDAAGRLYQTTRGTSANTITISSSTFDAAGRLLTSTKAPNEAGVPTTTTYTDVAGGVGRIKTTTYPGLTTRIEEYFLDGTLFKLSGTAAHPKRHQYGYNTSWGFYDYEVTLDSNGTTTQEFIWKFYNQLGANYLTLYPTFPNGFNPYTNIAYDGAGRPALTLDTDGLTHYVLYNQRGELETTITHVDGPNYYSQPQPLNAANKDRILTHLSEIHAHGGTGPQVLAIRTIVYKTDGNSTSTELAVEETSLDGHDQWIIQDGQTAHIQVSINRATAQKDVSTTKPDLSYQVQHYENGFLRRKSSYDKNGVLLQTQRFDYEPVHGRLVTSSSEQTGVAANDETTYTYYDDDQRKTVTTPVPGPGQSSQTTTYHYNGVNLVTQIDLPDAPNVVTYQYKGTGELKVQDGARNYHVEYDYETQGRLAKIYTWNTYVAGQPPSSTTQFSYNNWGFLQQKTYNDNKAVNYTYTSPSGKIDTRTWARNNVQGQRIVTKYLYNTAGDLWKINYNNDSSDNDLEFDYDRLGRRRTAVDRTDTANVITCNYGLYDDNSMQSETYSGSFMNGLSLQFGRDTYNRRTQAAVLNGATTLSQQTFGYNANSGRFDTVTSGNNTVSYGYLPMSSAIKTVMFKNGAVTRLTNTFNLDYINRLQSLGSISSAGIATTNVYQYNAANQRQRMDLEDGTYWVYGYDAHGEVTSGKHFWPSTALAGQQYIPGQQFEYSFDDIGNRIYSRQGGNESGATANLRQSDYTGDATHLNQYSQRTVPGYVEVIGSINPVGTPSVNDQIPYRRRDYFRKELNVDNSAATAYQAVNILGVYNGGTAADVDQTYSVSKMAIVPKTPEQYTYDFDGNLLSDGRWIYTWDIENRLQSAETIASTPNAYKKRVEFIYDYLGRRTRKTVKSWTGSAWDSGAVTKFIYEGWALLAELDSANNVARSYMWGIDVGGQYQTSGGVRGLLAVIQSGVTYYPTFDGSGNVMSLVSAVDGSIAARYQYGPFGEFIRGSGPMAKSNPWRFSTMYWDDETDLVYYGYRYYNPSTGRWLSRDPMGETCSANLYGFVNNNPANSFDVLGLYNSAGHFYTTYLVAMAAGFSPERAFNFAYWSQYPDQDGDFGAISASNRKNDVQRYIHSLTGGDPVLLRRYLECLIRSGRFDMAEIGFLIHALGDAYAHTYRDLDQWLGTPRNRVPNPRYGNDVLYPPWIGHGLAGHNPDYIGNNPAKYLAYVNQLYGILSGLNGAGTPRPEILTSLTDAANGFGPSNPYDFAFTDQKNDNGEAASLRDLPGGYNGSYNPDDKQNPFVEGMRRSLEFRNDFMERVRNGVAGCCRGN